MGALYDLKIAIEKKIKEGGVAECFHRIPVKKGDVMSLVKFDVTAPAAMASVLTTESVEELGLKPGDQVRLVIKAIHVLPVKE